MTEETSKATAGAAGLWETGKTVVYAVAIAFFIRTVAYEPFNIPSGSMIPTLLVGDYLFVSKYSYGYSNHSMPYSPRLFSGRLFETAPERGDVAVFKTPRDNSTDFIKRVVGLPGDRIQVISGRLHINGISTRRDRIENFYYDRRFGSTVPQYIETLPNGRKYRILEVGGDTAPLDNTPEYVVPARHYFMMGDNRDNSADSRVMPQTGDTHYVGFVPVENFVGRADILFFSTAGTDGWWKIWRWIPAMRFSRFFQAIE